LFASAQLKETIAIGAVISRVFWFTQLQTGKGVGSGREASPGGSAGGVALTVRARQEQDADTQGLARRAVKRGQARMHSRANECWHVPLLKSIL